MGCTVSQLDGSKSDEYLTEKKISDDCLEPDTAPLNRKITRLAAPLELSENCCAFCEFDDELGEIKDPGAASMETLSTLATVVNVSALPVTIDSPSDIDEEFEMSHSSLSSAGLSSSTSNLMPGSFGESVHQEEDTSLESNSNENESSNHDLIAVGAHPTNQLVHTSLIITAHNTFHDGFSAPIQPNFGGSTIVKRLSLRKANAMSEYADKLHVIKCSNSTPYSGGTLKSGISGISGERTSMPDTVLDLTSNAMIELNGKPSKLPHGGLQDSGDETDRNDLPHSVSPGRLHLSPSSSTSIQNLHTHVPFANPSESTKKEMEGPESPLPAQIENGVGVKRLSSRIYPKKLNLTIEGFSTKYAINHSPISSSRESVKTSVDKIEAMSKEMRLPLSPLKINTSARSGPLLRQASRLSVLQPLSPTKFAPRNIPSVGRNGPSKGDIFVGGYDDSRASPKEKSSNEIADVLQKPSPKNMHQFFTPVNPSNRQKRSPSNHSSGSKHAVLTPASPLVNIDDSEESNVSSETSDAKCLRLRESVMSSVTKTDYTASPRPPPPTVSRNFHFSPPKGIDMFSVTTCEPLNVKKNIEALQNISPASSAPGTPRPGTPTSSQRFPDGSHLGISRVQ